VASPQAPRRRSSLLWLFFGLKGRISRSVYWLACLFLIALNSVLIGQLVGGEEASYFRLAQALGPFVIIATLYSNFVVAAKRLHDIGYTGLFALAIFIPLVNLAFTIWAGLIPGTAGPNKHGAAPDRPPP
jgi:uncharacterized membrane protein YhaH (DUF805 family)